MIRKEIKHLKLKVGEYDNISVSIPTSIVSALVDEGLCRDPYFGTNAEGLRSVASLGATFTAEFDMDPVMLAQDSLILRLHGFDAPMVLSVNGAPVAGLERSHVMYEVDIKSRVTVGKNTVTMRFAPRYASEEYITDIAIFAPIELVAYSKAIIDDVTVSQKFDGDNVRLSINMTTKGYNLKPSAVAVLVSPSGAVSYCTLTGGKGEMLISSPNLWRPGRSRGHRLYRLTLNLYSDSVLIDSRECKVGLRSLEYTEGANPPIKISGTPYLPIAVKYSTADLVRPRATEAKVEQMLRRVADTGIDMIFARSAVSYPSEHFLSCCDELGIALAVRIIAPTAERTPISEQLAEKDLRRSLRRLALHPSVLLLSGGGDYADIARRVAAELIPDAIYLDKELVISDSLPSLPTDATSRMYFGEGDLNITAPAFIERGCAGLDELMRAAATTSRMPHSFGEWSYLSSILSAERAVASLRADMRSREGLGACLLELTEPIPALSASVLDYRLGAKAAYYYLKKETADRSVYAELDGFAVSFYTVNREAVGFKSRLNYLIISADNRVIVRDSVEIAADADSVSLAYKFDASAVIAGHEREYYLLYSLTDARGAYSRGTLLFVKPRLFEFKKPSITAEISGSGTEYAVTLYSDVYTRAVEVYIDGEEDVILEDNFFDITSDVPVRLKLTAARPVAIETLRRELRVRSFYDVGR